MLGLQTREPGFGFSNYFHHLPRLQNSFRVAFSIHSTRKLSGFCWIPAGGRSEWRRGKQPQTVLGCPPAVSRIFFIFPKQINVASESLEAECVFCILKETGRGAGGGGAGTGGGAGGGKNPCKSLSPSNKLTAEANDLAPVSKWVLCQELKDERTAGRQLLQAPPLSRGEITAEQKRLLGCEA